MRLYIVGIGPGEATQMTQRAQAALERSELIVGYTAYVDLVRPLFPEKSFLTTSMRGEVERCRLAVEPPQRSVRSLVCGQRNWLIR